MNRKKILVVCPRFPYPVIGGDRLRIFRLCDYLKETYDLTLVSLCESKAELELAVPDDAVFLNVHKIYMPKWRSYFNSFFALFGSDPIQTAYYRNKRLGDKIESLISSHDAILCHLVRTAPYMSLVKNKPKILEATDSISLNYERAVKIFRFFNLKALLYKIEQKRLKRYEEEVISSASLSIFISDVDKSYLCGDSFEKANKTIVCPNGVDFKFLKSFYDPGGLDIVFVANMLSMQNFDAAFWFAKNVLPKLRRIDNYRFKIIGRISSKQSNKLSKMDGVVVTGQVDSIYESVAGALVAVCPMRIGAGVQNKVLEYMSLGLPAIISPMSKEGIPIEDNKEILIADSDDQFVDKILEVRFNKGLAGKLSKNGRQFVEENLSWQSVFEPLKTKLDGLI